MCVRRCRLFLYYLLKLIAFMTFSKGFNGINHEPPSESFSMSLVQMSNWFVPGINCGCVERNILPSSRPGIRFDQ